MRTSASKTPRVDENKILDFKQWTHVWLGLPCCTYKGNRRIVQPSAGEGNVFRGLSAKRLLMRLWRRMTGRIGYFALFFIVYTTVVFHFHFCARFDKEFEQSNVETMTRRNRGPPPIFYPLVVFLPSRRRKSIPEILSCQLVFLKRPVCTLDKRRKDIFLRDSTRIIFFDLSTKKKKKKFAKFKWTL